MTKTPKQRHDPQLAAFAAQFSHFNGGIGLIVPKSLAQRLRRLGATEGFTEQSDLPLSDTDAVGRRTMEKPAPEKD